MFDLNNITKIQFVPHRKHYVSATKPSRLMLCGETVAVYCENRTEHTDTLPNNIYKNSVRTSEEMHYASATKTKRLLLLDAPVAVYYENHMEHKLCGRMQPLPRRKHITSRLQSPTDNAVWGNSRCLL
jgi:hypothetical protein